MFAAWSHDQITADHDPLQNANNFNTNYVGVTNLNGFFTVFPLQSSVVHFQHFAYAYLALIVFLCV